MKVEHELLNIERGGDVEEDNFSIEASPEAFEVISAGIYTDRVLAPIRELSANAADAHVDAGTTHIPFEIHAPNNLESHFGIRDFGTGLSPEQIKKLYTRYFKSTKTNDNTKHGFMGLGSKSPFAYVDSFTVISYWHGVKYVFNCYKNERRVPSISLLGQEATTEQNGLEVTFPVQGHDSHQFGQKIKEALRFFESKPIIKGWYNFEFDNAPDYMIKTDEYGIVQTRETSLVVMGNVGYPIDRYDFEATKDQLSIKERKLVDWGVHLFVPLGSVTPAASREKLTYTPETRATIKNLLELAIAATESEAKKKLEEAKDLWAARCLIGKVRKGVLGEICDFSPTGDLDWNGTRISEIISLDDYPKGEKPAHIEVLSTEPDTSYSYRRRRRNSNSNPGRNSNSNPGRTSGLHRWQVNSFGAGDYKTIFVNDLNRGGYAAAKRYMEENDVEKALMASDMPQCFIDSTGCQDLLIPVSTLPKLERQKRGSGQSRAGTDRTLMQEWLGTSFSNLEVDLSDGGVYIETRRDKVKIPTSFKSTSYDFSQCSSLLDKVGYMRLLGFTDTIYGIRPCDLQRISKYEDEWMSVEEALEDIMKQNAHLVPLACIAATYAHIDHKCVNLGELDLDDSSLMKRAVKVCQECVDAVGNDKITAFRNLNDYVHMYEIKKEEWRVELAKKVTETYPLLQYVHYWGGDAVEAIAKYVQLIDQQLLYEEDMEAAA